MKYAIIVSEKDLAGMNIKKTLLDLYSFEKKGVFESEPVYELENTKLYTTQKDSVYCENMDMQIKADMFIFATKHESKSGIPSLSVHTQGNWGSADFGGKKSQLAVSPANYLKKGLIKLQNLAKNTDYDIIQECTHHGPYLQKPSMFIEIGSSKQRWTDKNASNIIAETIHSIITSDIPKYRTAVGIGGLHHTPNFKKIILDSDIAIGHVCPKYMVKNLTLEMIKQAMDRTIPKSELIILDWKGLSGHKDKIKRLMKKIDVEIKRTKEF
ncbi:MAG: D-aminoacyl-tRNA deacylase [Candidatus Woesearchaeota archaeon]|nr:D-aminoacyl-tRNA deacylase [Candidatus Woesearchaeota archaeon]